MIIKFEKIVMHNFMSFGDSELELNNSGYVLVTGINKNPVDNASSNGSGKSSIWEAIAWALTGETIRGGSKDIRNIFTEGGAFVELTFSVDNDIYKILRSKEHTQYKTNLKIYKNDEDVSGKGIRDSEALLKEYLPDLTSSLIGSVIILGQGLPQRFSNNTPSGRKDVLEKLSKSDFMIDDLKKRVTDRKIALNSSLRDFENLINTINGSLQILNKSKADIEAKLNNLVWSESYDKEADDYRQLVESCTSQRAEESKNLEVISGQLTELRDKLTSRKVEKTEAIHNKKEEYRETLQSLQDSKRDICYKISTLESEIRQLESITDVCPTCNQKLPNVIKPDTSDKRNSLASLKENLKDIETRIDEINSQSSQEIQILENEFNVNIKRVEDSIKVLEKTVNVCTERIKSIDKNLEEARKKLSDILFIVQNYQTQVTQLQTDKEAVEAQIVDLSEKLLYNNSEKENIQRHIEVINKINALVTRDFRGYLLTGIINYIQSKAIEYSLQLFETDKINFLLDGNNINISYNGKLYEDLSGGEKQKVDLIIQFSIRDMLCKYLNFSCNILVLDEITDNLDDVGCEKVLNLISTALKDINSIYIISHRASDLAIPYDREIIVEKNIDGISVIK